MHHPAHSITFPCPSPCFIKHSCTCWDAAFPMHLIPMLVKLVSMLEGKAQMSSTLVTTRQNVTVHCETQMVTGAGYLKGCDQRRWGPSEDLTVSRNLWCIRTRRQPNNYKVPAHQKVLDRCVVTAEETLTVTGPQNPYDVISTNISRK